MIIAPALFLIIGYSVMYIIGKPVIQFVTSTVEIMLLNEAPTFDFDTDQSFETVNNDDVKTDADNQLASSTIDYPKGGTKYGQVVISDLKIEEPLYFGDTPQILRNGAGQFMGSVYPGEMGTTLIGGHNTASFGKLLDIKAGTKVVIQTTYGNYTYEVTEAHIKNKNDETIQSLIDQREQRILLLYTCYPINSYQLGMTNERMFVTCKLTDGPIINEQA